MKCGHTWEFHLDNDLKEILRPRCVVVDSCTEVRQPALFLPLHSESDVPLHEIHVTAILPPKCH